MGYIFLIDLLVVALSIPVMPIPYSKQRLFEASVTVCLCKHHIARYCENSDNRILSEQRRPKSIDPASMFAPNKVKCALPCQT